MAINQDQLIRKEEKKQQKLDAGLIADKYPSVSNIRINIVYRQKTPEKIFMKRVMHYSPSHSAYFNIECFTKGCLDGGFELTPCIRNMIRTSIKTEKGKLACKGKIDEHAQGHINIDYEIKIRYNGTA